MAEERIGLFGGSFDPVHRGHLLVAQAAQEELGLSRVFFIPAAQSPFKPHLKAAPPAERLRLLRLALAGQSAWKIDDQELRRGGLSYSIDTLRRYRERFPKTELFYLIGADHLHQLPSWRDASELARMVEFVIVPRPGTPLLDSPEAFRVRRLRGCPLAVSSSEIRRRIQKGLSIHLLVGREVAEAIQKMRLYL
jgi:nicotinate-nucleotide adenylyltransferase